VDIVVTVPKDFRYGGKKGLAAWLSEGDAPGEPWSGDTYDFSTFGVQPNIEFGEVVYVACEGRIVGYAPLVAMMFKGEMVVDEDHPKAVIQKGLGPILLVRGGDAVAVTIPQAVVGFRSWRYRWWERSIETELDLSGYLK
jgi:hypothetical protein